MARTRSPLAPVVRSYRSALRGREGTAVAARIMRAAIDSAQASAWACSAMTRLERGERLSDAEAYRLRVEAKDALTRVEAARLL